VRNDGGNVDESRGRSQGNDTAAEIGDPAPAESATHADLSAGPHTPAEVSSSEPRETIPVAP